MYRISQSPDIDIIPYSKYISYTSVVEYVNTYIHKTQLLILLIVCIILVPMDYRLIDQC